MFKAWQLAAIDEAGYNGIREEHISRVADSLRGAGVTQPDRNTFDYHCNKCGIDSANFTQSSIKQLLIELDS